MWSFVGNKKNKQWIWLAVDTESRKIIGLYVGDRSKKGALGLWNSIPRFYRDNAHFYSDFWESYSKIFPSDRHSAVGKETGLTNHVERLNNTFRQRCSRLVRETLSFSKKLENHIGAIWNFTHYYNATLGV